MAARVAFVHCHTKPSLINKEHQLAECQGDRLSPYLKGTAKRCHSSAISSHVYCWILRGCNVTLAECKPENLLASTSINSEALNRLATPFRARVNARRVAASRVIPKPFRVQGRCTPRKCQPIWRTMVSKIGAVISFRRFQCSPQGSRSGSRRSGRMHSLRRKTECGFTPARFSILRAPQGGRNRANDRLARPFHLVTNVPQRNPEQKSMDRL